MRSLIVLAVVAIAVCVANPAAKGSGKKAMTNAPGGEHKKKGDVPPPHAHDRKKRGICGKATKMASADQANILTDHNAKRKKTSGAADMSKMSWNAELADRAQEWADSCIWAHGMSNMCDENVPLGQNMYMTTGSSVDVLEVMDAWYNEYKDFDYTHNLCSEGAICGHYTQLVWSESHEVGCGIAQCPSVAVGDGFWENAVILVCDYWPTGNWVDELPYTTGDSCSQCRKSLGSIVSGITCDEGLCKPCLPSVDPTCVCDDSDKAACTANSATWDDGLCRCVCPAGFYGDFCDKSCTCADSADYASACPSWSASGLCTDEMYGPFMASACPASCNMCGELPAECQ